jgi:trimethylamine:corrinoid methyltransferase-like protein
LDDLPSDHLVDHLTNEGHLITAAQTLEHWPRELYQTDPVIDRTTRDTAEKTAGPSLVERACAQVESRLARYQAFETDPAVDAAMRDIIMSGLESQDKLPDLPPPPEAGAARTAPAGRRGRAGRRRRR